MMANLPKRLQKLLAEDSRVDRIDDERAEGNGYWVYLAPGYFNADLECHCIHESTVSAVQLAMLSVVPCSCEICRSHQGAL